MRHFFKFFSGILSAVSLHAHTHTHMLRDVWWQSGVRILMMGLVYFSLASSYLSAQNIIVPTGQMLTISANTTFQPNTGIVVMPGAILTIGPNVTLSTAVPGQNWQGITILGRQSPATSSALQDLEDGEMTQETQNYFLTDIGSPGLLLVRSGVTINNANIAINCPIQAYFLNDIPALSAEDFNHTLGGTFYLVGAPTSKIVFRNNDRDIYMDYTTSFPEPVDPVSYIANFDPTAFNAYVYHCIFFPENQPTYFAEFKHVGRIFFGYSRIHGQGTIALPNINRGVLLQNTFGHVKENIIDLIYRGFSTQSTVSFVSNNDNYFGLNFVKNTFRDVQKGIYAVGDYMILFSANTFFIPRNDNQTGDTELQKNYGIKLVEQQLYDVGSDNVYSEPNYFYNSGNGTYLNYGMIVYGCPQNSENFISDLTGGSFNDETLDESLSANSSYSYSGDVIGNEFRGTSYGLYYMGWNDGADVQCNEFATNGIPHGVSAWRVAGGIMGDQGSLGNQLLNIPPTPISNKWWDNSSSANLSPMPQRDIHSVEAFSYNTHTFPVDVFPDGNTRHNPASRNALVTLNQIGGYFLTADNICGGGSYILPMAPPNPGEIGGVKGVVTINANVCNNAIKYETEGAAIRPSLIGADYLAKKSEFDRYKVLESSALKCASGTRNAVNRYESMMKILSESPLMAAQYMKLDLSLRNKDYRVAEEVIGSYKRRGQLPQKIRLYEMAMEKSRRGGDWSADELEELGEMAEKPSAAFVQAKTILAAREGRVYYHPEGKEDAEDELISLEDTASSTIRIWPNPVTEYLTIQNITNQEAHFVVYNTGGRLLHKLAVSAYGTAEFPTAQLAPGMYLLKVVSESSDKEDAYRFIKVK